RTCGTSPARSDSTETSSIPSSGPPGKREISRSSGRTGNRTARCSRRRIDRAERSARSIVRNFVGSAIALLDALALFSQPPLHALAWVLQLPFHELEPFRGSIEPP